MTTTKTRTPAAAFSDKPYVHIPLTGVASDQIAGHGYSLDTGTLALCFKGPGHVYHYTGIPVERYEEFKASESKGSFFAQHFKALPCDKFPAELVQQHAAAAGNARPATTPQSIAAALNGIEYGVDLPNHIIEAAKAAGIVIVTGSSDDLIEFDGAFRDEGAVYEGGTVQVDSLGVLPNWETVRDEGDEVAAAAYLARKKNARQIEARWSPALGTQWDYKTAILHSTFEVKDGDLIHCRGIVFSLADLAATPAAAD